MFLHSIFESEMEILAGKHGYDTQTITEKSVVRFPTPMVVDAPCHVSANNVEVSAMSSTPQLLSRHCGRDTNASDHTNLSTVPGSYEVIHSLQTHLQLQ